MRDFLIIDELGIKYWKMNHFAFTEDKLPFANKKGEVVMIKYLFYLQKENRHEWQ